MRSISKSEAVRNLIIEDIHAGWYASGDALPSIETLAKRFEVLFLRNSGRKHLRFRRFCGTLYSRREDENLKSRSRLGTSAFRRVE